MEYWMLNEKATGCKQSQNKPDADRRLRQANRFARILRIMQLIQGRGRWDAKSIAQEIECSQRTVYRDLAVLELAGVPWNYEKVTSCYRLCPNYQFPVLNLTDEELLGQATATVTSQAPGLYVNLGAKPTSEKLSAKADKKSESILTEAQRFTQVLDLKLVDHDRHREIIRTVEWALIEKKQITGHYQSPYEANPVKLTLHPLRLAMIKQAWYLIAQSEKEKEPRTYRIVRFQSLRMTDNAARIPNDFDMRGYLGNAWGVYRGEKSYLVELQFDSDIAAIIQETKWHHTQKAKKHGDGSVSLHFQVDGLNEIVRWIVSYAGQVRVIEPKELRDLVISRHKEALEKNGSNPTPDPHVGRGRGNDEYIPGRKNHVGSKRRVG